MFVFIVCSVLFQTSSGEKEKKEEKRHGKERQERRRTTTRRRREREKKRERFTRHSHQPTNQPTNHHQRKKKKEKEKEKEKKKKKRKKKMASLVQGRGTDDRDLTQPHEWDTSDESDIEMRCWNVFTFYTVRSSALSPCSCAQRHSHLSA